MAKLDSEAMTALALAQGAESLALRLRAIAAACTDHADSSAAQADLLPEGKDRSTIAWHAVVGRTTADLAVALADRLTGEADGFLAQLKGDGGLVVDEAGEAK